MDISNQDSTPVSAGERRKSGRAVRAPAKFAPELASSQPVNSNSKRKRKENDAEDDASDLEEEVETSDTEESAGEEEVKESRKRARPAKPAAKKPKVNGTASHDEGPALKLTSRPKKARKIAIADEDAQGLYGKGF